MRNLRVFSLPAVIVLIGSLLAVVPAAAQSSTPGTRQIPAGGTTSIRSGTQGPMDSSSRNSRPGSGGEEGAGSFNRPRPGFKNGKFPKKPLDAPTVPSSAVAARTLSSPSASTA